MDSDFPLPPIPGTNGSAGLSTVGPFGSSGNYAQTNSPFFSVANQFLPRNLHDVIRWAKFITMQSPVTTEVIRKFSTYPITEFIVDTKSERLSDKYKEIFKSFRLKQSLHNVGFEYYTVGNVFISIYWPILRTLECKECKACYPAKNAEFLQFKNFKFVGTCPTCGYSGEFRRTDTKSTNISDMNMIKWDPLNIAVHNNPITGECEYYYKIPNDVKKRVHMGDRLFVNSTPWDFIEAIKNNQDFKFDNDSIYHLKNVSAGHELNGVAIPPLISLFGLVFYQTTLRRANESISSDYMAPLRVIYPTAQTGQSDPVAAMSMRNFVNHMTRAMVAHKKDKNHVLIAPVPIGYQTVSGEGKNLLVTAEIQAAEESILLSLGVSRDLLMGVTNWQSSSVGLRLLENTMLVYTSQIQGLIDWMMAKICKYLSLEYCSVKLQDFKLTDDDSLRQFLAQKSLAGDNSVSPSTVYEAFGMNYTDELESGQKDMLAKAIKDIETKFLVDQAVFVASKEVVDKFDKDSEYLTKLGQAQAIAQQLYSVDYMSQMTTLNQLEIADYPMYLLVGRLLDEFNEGQASQGMGTLSDPNNPNAQQGDDSTGSDGQGSKGGGGGEPPSGGMKPSTDGKKPQSKTDIKKGMNNE